MSPKRRMPQPARPASRRSRSKQTATIAPPPLPPAAVPQQGVLIRTLNGASYSITLPDNFQATALYWEYVLQNRSRWSQDASASQTVQEQCVKLLADVGIDQNGQAEIAQSGVVEIDIPYRAEALGWELRIFPWEFLLFTATASRRTQPLIVLRHVSCADRNCEAGQIPKKFMVVESAPGDLSRSYTFASEIVTLVGNGTNCTRAGQAHGCSPVERLPSF